MDSRLRLYAGPIESPTILFFHGNGETGSDYDAAAEAYNRLPVTFAVAEYRGYGPCGGTPSLSTFLSDAHASFEETRKILTAEERSQTIVVMGRSLGSAPAIELAASRGEEIAGLVVESGFARIVPLLELLGIPTASLGIDESHGPRSAEKIGRVTLPTLIMHAVNDMIIPIADGEALFAANNDPDRTFLRVPDAGHNDISLVAGASYFDAIEALLDRT
ncbi:MAG: alpha/beta hydrolase [Deltaproteobacteria bacterium]|nr:alpha/beta hydrolase [Deltaproteobacteria bacterium]